jgi:hypothetical protein
MGNHGYSFSSPPSSRPLRVFCRWPSLTGVLPAGLSGRRWTREGARARVSCRPVVVWLFGRSPPYGVLLGVGCEIFGPGCAADWWWSCSSGSSDTWSRKGPLGSFFRCVEVMMQNLSWSAMEAEEKGGSAVSPVLLFFSWPPRSEG